MRILIVTPATAGSRQGNRITANRWRTRLGEVGHRVTITDAYADQACDVGVFLHAKKNAPAIRRFAESRPQLPLIVALTGTDLYRDIAVNQAAQHSLDVADRLILLQPDGIQALDRRYRHKARVIYQSVPPVRPLPSKLKSCFEVIVIGHLRPVKDPFRTAHAARYLPATSRIRIVHCGQALSQAMRRQAEREMARNARYRWLGELPRWKTRQRLARSRLMVLSSKSEGGANVVSEALACRVPMLTSRISGSIGLLGANYPGYFPTGDTRALTQLLRRAEEDSAFYRQLVAACRDREWLIEPKLERQSWQSLLAEVSSD